MKKAIGLFIVSILSVVLVYIGYVYLSYHRIEDQQSLAIINETSKKQLLANEDYTVVSYNIGYGSYPPDYTFFMDGGKRSRAKNKESVVQTIDGVIETIKKRNSDFMLFQEVDEAATRSYHVNEVTSITNAFPMYQASFAVNYDSAYLFYPLLEPIGKSKSGLLTVSNTEITASTRYSLPIETNVNKFFDLDRAFTVSKIPVENGKNLMIFNVHLSAYIKDEKIQKAQMNKLFDQMEKEYLEGNYVICGGDFNHDLLDTSNEVFENSSDQEYSWLQPFSEKDLPNGLRLMSTDERDSLVPSVRNLDEPYEKGKSFVALIDGFILSENVEGQKMEVVDTNFLYSDHNPVELTFQLKDK